MSIRLFKSPAYKHNFFKEEEEEWSWIINSYEKGCKTVLQKMYFGDLCTERLQTSVQFAFFTIMVKRTLKDDLPFFELTATPRPQILLHYYYCSFVCLHLFKNPAYKDFLHSFFTEVRVGHPLTNKLLQEIVSNKKRS